MVLGLIGISASFAATPEVVTPDPIPEEIANDGLAVELIDFIQVPASSSKRPLAMLNFLFHAGDGSGRLFVADSRGKIYVIKDGRLLAAPFLDIAAVRGSRFHIVGEVEGRMEGIRTFAFHPDFVTPGAKGYGKFYTVHTEIPGSTPDNPNVRIFTSPSENIHHQDVITEWTIDSENPDRIDPDSRRELMRIEQPALTHNTGQIAFNPNANPGDPDYGMMYIAVGDGGYLPLSDKEWQRQGQNTRTPFGTILRINPRRNGTSPYTVPRDNPFVDEANFLPEIWAFGLRNPERFSWDTGGDGKMLIADIGESNVEEINLGVPGANYGWSEREGTFVVSHDDRSVLFALPADETPGKFTYPVAQYDHGDGFAIVGGFVYRGSLVPGLYGKYIFGDILTGRIFYLEADDLVIGRRAVIHELTLLRNGVATTLLDILGDDYRADLRFGMDEDGEIYILTKRDGMIRTWYQPFTSP